LVRDMISSWLFSWKSVISFWIQSRGIKYVIWLEVWGSCWVLVMVLFSPQCSETRLWSQFR
jgi:hypothetical protein